VRVCAFVWVTGDQLPVVFGSRSSSSDFYNLPTPKLLISVVNANANPEMGLQLVSASACKNGPDKRIARVHFLMREACVLLTRPNCARALLS
jgi:hypothetical protein